MPASASSSGATQQPEARTAATPARVSAGALLATAPGACEEDAAVVAIGDQAPISCAVIW
jgi:hypothetical protein